MNPLPLSFEFEPPAFKTTYRYRETDSGKRMRHTVKWNPETQDEDEFLRGLRNEGVDFTGIGPYLARVARLHDEHVAAKLARVEAVRCFSCPLYDRCLDEAIEKDWDGFSCVGCPLRTA